MISKKSEELDEELRAAEEALKAAQNMPGGPERIAALRKAGQMRFDASQKKYPAEDSGKSSGDLSIPGRRWRP
jgi:hypothetical protein